MTEKRSFREKVNFLRRLAAFFLIFAVAFTSLPVMSVSVKAADTGCWKWRFKKVTSQRDLPTTQSWFPVLIVYNYQWTDYILNSTETVSKEVCKLSGIKVSHEYSERVAVGIDALLNGKGLPDTYNGDFPYGLWMYYAGKDSDNSNAKMYYMKESKDGSSLYYTEDGFGKYSEAKKIYSDTELKDIKDDIRNAATVDGQLCSPYTIMTEGIRSTSAEHVKIVSNVSGTDSSFKNDNGGVLLSDWVGGNSYAYDEFTMYVGERYWDSSVNAYGSKTVYSGQTLTVTNANIGLEDTITVEEDATLIIKGNVYFNGIIENYGTVVVEDGSLQATHYLTGKNDRTVYGCYRGYQGSSLIVLSGSNVLVGGDPTESGYNYGRNGTGIELYGGSLVNNGTVYAPLGMKLSGAAEIVNGTAGNFYVGYYPRRGRLGNMDAYIGTAIAGVDAEQSNSYFWDRKFVVFSCSGEGDQYPIVQNSGNLELEGEWITDNGSTRVEMTASERAKILIERAGSVWYQNGYWLVYWRENPGKYSSWQNTNAALW